MFWLAAGLLAYHYFFYPGLIFCLGSMRREVRDKECQGGAATPFVSLIIPAHNEEPILEAKLTNALSLVYPRDRMEIIVASDGSTDRTVEIAQRFVEQGGIVRVFPQRRGKAAVVNDACCEARGDVICLCDANVMFAPDALGRLIARLNDPSVGAVSGNVRIASQESNFGAGEMLFYRIERAIQWGESCVGSMMGVDGGMYVIRRELVRPLPADTILDDFVMTLQVIRQGKRVVYEPTAVASENATALARQEWRRRVRVSAGAAQSLKRRQWPPSRRPVEVWQYLSHKVLRWMCPLLLAVLLVACASLWGVHWFYRLTLIGQCAVYGVAGVALLSVRFRKSDAGGIAFYFVLGNVAIGYGLIRGLFNLQPVTWAQADRAAILTKCS